MQAILVQGLETLESPGAWDGQEGNLCFRAMEKNEVTDKSESSEPIIETDPDMVKSQHLQKKTVGRACRCQTEAEVSEFRYHVAFDDFFSNVS